MIPFEDDTRVTPIHALAHLAPDFLDGLDPVDRALLPYAYDVLSRPPQAFPRGNAWRFLGFICGRGWGKSWTIAKEINARIERGEIKHLGLMAPNEDRTEEVQVSFLVDSSPPWFKAERYLGGVRWPNGVRAITFTPQEPGRSRSENLDFAWLCELVDWNASTRVDAFENITTATRVGNAQVVWDTTSKGRNDVIRSLMAMHAADPETFPIVRGTLFDNPTLPDKYLRETARKYTGRRYDEEVRGLVFAESGGALWLDEWIEKNRVDVSPAVDVDLRLVAIDPALSTREGTDETGIAVGCRTRAGHAFIEQDLSGKHRPETWGALAVEAGIKGKAAGIVIERNNAGDPAVFVLRSVAKDRGVQIREIPNDGSRFPAHTPGVLYVRQVHPNTSKTTRAEGPAAETKQGRVHLVGHFAELERQLTSYEPCTGQKSPNNFDAFTHLVNELLELTESKPRTRTGDVERSAEIAAQLNRRITDHTSARGRGAGLPSRAPRRGLGL